MTAPPPATDAAIVPPKPSAPLAWLGTADLAIGALVVLLAALVAAHVSRNSDQWLNLAAGRDLLNGRYTLGTDPYSTLHVDQPWVNHSWLTDVVLFKLYSISGEAVTAAKALVFALAFFTVLLVRKPGTPAWPWWLLATVGILAAAPQTTLRPAVVSALGVALSLIVLFRLNWAAGSWRNPLLLAGLTALWANLDRWFFFAPLTIAAVLVAEIVQRRLLKTADSDAPRVLDLARAMLLSLAATLVNPHHVGVWQIPIELGIGLPAALHDDPGLANLALPAYDKLFYSRPDLGGNVNGAAFLVLFLIGGGLLALGLSRVRLAGLFVWLLFAVFALLYHRCILFFAIAAVPMAALPLADIAVRFAAASGSKLPATLSSLGRILGFPALIILLLCAWPGWLHPKPTDPAFVNRVALGVEPDPGLARTAVMLHDWRKSGVLAETVTGAPLSFEMANHIAWFAPGERIAVNGRFTHHRADLPDFLKARAAEAAGKSADLAAALTPLKAEFAIINRSGARVPLDILTALQLAQDELALWHLDGRTAILGKKSSGSALAFDPVPRAFRVQPPLPDPAVGPSPSRSREASDDFLQSPRPVPLAALDASTYQAYAAQLWSRAVQNQQRRSLAVAALTGPGLQANVSVEAILPDAAIAANLLGQRAARLAIDANPDHPLAYHALAMSMLASETPLPGFAADGQQAIFLASARRYLDRVPLPADTFDALDAVKGNILSEQMARIYYTAKMEDLGRDAARLAMDYQKRVLALYVAKPPEKPIPEAVLKAELARLDQGLEGLNKSYAQRLEQYQTAAAAPLPQRLQAALQSELPGEAMKLMKDADFDKEFGAGARQAQFLQANIAIKAGMIDDAVRILGALQEKLKTVRTDPDAQRLDADVVQKLPGLIAEAQRVAGDFGAYAKSLDDYQAPKQPLPPGLREQVRAALADPTGLRATGLPAAALGGAFGGFVSQVALDTPLINYWHRLAEYYHRRALVALLDGRTAEATRYFELSLAPEGVAVPAFSGDRVAAERYLRLIRNSN